MNVWLKIKCAHTALPVKSVPTYVCMCRSFECKGLLRCPLGSCDCAKAERRVQRAAALRKSLLLCLQTGSCLLESCFLDRRRQKGGEIYRGWNRGVRKKQACDSCRMGGQGKVFFSTLAEPALSTTRPRRSSRCLRHILLQVCLGAEKKHH